MATPSLAQSCASQNEIETLKYHIHKMISLLGILRKHLLDTLGEPVRDDEIEAILFLVDAVCEIATHERSESIGEHREPPCSL